MLYNLRPVAAPTLTNLTATPGINQVSLHWDIPVDATFKSSQVWTNLTNNTVSASLLATVDGNTFVHQSGDTNQRFYWVRAVNIYGRTDGAWSNGIQGNGRLITGTDIAPGAVNLSTHVTGLLSAGNVTGLGALAILDRLGIAKIDGLGLLATQSSVNGQTQVTNLGSLAYANSIAANQIGAGTLAAGVAYVGTLSASQITSGVMSADHINGGTISGVSMNISGNFVVNGSTGFTQLFTANLTRCSGSNGDAPGLTAFTVNSSGSGGAITVNGGSGDALTITGGSNGIRQTNSGTNWLSQLNPNSDNGPALGTASFRWAQVYSGTATINTSDVNQKQQIRPLNDAEHAVAARLKSLIRMFKFNDAVTLKGDAARWHIGVIAQQVQDAFVAEGLDAFAYGVVCYDSWEDQYQTIPPTYMESSICDEYGKPILVEATPERQELVKTAGNQYGVRYEELFAFIIAAL